MAVAAGSSAGKEAGAAEIKASRRSMLIVPPELVARSGDQHRIIGAGSSAQNERAWALLIQGRERRITLDRLTGRQRKEQRRLAWLDWHLRWRRIPSCRKNHRLSC
jgi:hypothetical protein